MSYNLLFFQTKIEESRIYDFLNAAQEFGVKGLAEDMKELSETLQNQCGRANENTADTANIQARATEIVKFITDRQ